MAIVRSLDLAPCMALACVLLFVIAISKYHIHAYNAMRNLLSVPEHILPVAYGRPYSRCNRSHLDDNDYYSKSAQVMVVYTP